MSRYSDEEMGGNAMLRTPSHAKKHAGKLTVKFVTSDGETVKVVVPCDALVSDAKRELGWKYGVHPICVKLMCHNNTLADVHRIAPLCEDDEPLQAVISSMPTSVSWVESRSGQNGIGSGDFPMTMSVKDFDPTPLILESLYDEVAGKLVCSGIKPFYSDPYGKQLGTARISFDPPVSTLQALAAVSQHYSGVNIAAGRNWTLQFLGGDKLINSVKSGCALVCRRHSESDR